MHIGNYFGAVRQHVALQEHNEAIIFIADYHSLTSIPEARERRVLVHDIALDYLALGLDPARAVFYRQSDLPEVTELAWILSTVTPMGLLERAHAYKDKVAQGLSADAGLFGYPVLQAADILIHRSDLVPVGQDQKQHIEMTRDIAAKFNQVYGDVLRSPEPLIFEDVAVVPGTDGRKMSKIYGNTVEMFSDEKTLRRQVMGVVTDSTPVEGPKDPDRSNLFALWRLFADDAEREAMAERFRRGGLGEDALREGAARARETAGPLMEEVRRATGIGRP
jgi:tryptophanyl-tRNA synthetase